MLSDLMVPALVAAVDGVSAVQERGAVTASWSDVADDVGRRVIHLVHELPQEQVDALAGELGVQGGLDRRQAVEEAVLSRVEQLVSAALAA